MPTRDLGLNHGPGKGDAPRNMGERFRKNLDNISWGREAEGFERRGQRLVKVYGPRSNDRAVRQVLFQPGAPNQEAIQLQRLANSINSDFAATGRGGQPG